MKNLSKKISKVLKSAGGNSSNNSRKWGKTTITKVLTLDCSSEHSTDSLLEQLEASQSQQITHLTLKDSLQRPDNVRIFNALQAIVCSDDKHCRLRQIQLLEPDVYASSYKRWSYKKTNFLHHVYRQCKERDIGVVIHGTLIMETPEDEQQDVSTWLQHLQKTVPEDPDITSLWISLRHISTKKPKHAASSSSGSQNTGLHWSNTLYQSAVQQVMQALIELLNGDSRPWKFIHCHVLYTQVPKYGVPQTEALMDVAEVYDVPLQVQWQPIDHSNKAGRWVRNTSRAEYLLPGSSSSSSNMSSSKNTTTACKVKEELEDTTASTVCYEGSSGALSPPIH